MKKKEQPISITHTELICFALNYLGEKINELYERAKLVEDKDPTLAAALREANVFLPKYKAAMQMYKLETGSDYQDDLGIL